MVDGWSAERQYVNIKVYNLWGSVDVDIEILVHYEIEIPGIYIKFWYSIISRSLKVWNWFLNIIKVTKKYKGNYSF